MFAGNTDHIVRPTPGNGPHHRHWRFPPWMVWGGLHEQQRNYRSFNPPPFIRRIPPRSHTISSDFKICDCPIVCYFSMSISLILIGCLTTFFVLDDTFDSFSHAVSQLWLVGPLFISCGIVIFVRTIRKRLQRQRTVEYFSPETFQFSVHRFIFLVKLLPVDYSASLFVGAKTAKAASSETCFRWTTSRR